MLRTESFTSGVDDQTLKVATQPLIVTGSLAPMKESGLLSHLDGCVAAGVRGPVPGAPARSPHGRVHQRTSLYEGG